MRVYKKARVAACRTPSRPYQKPMSRYDESPISSQEASSNIQSPASTRVCIAAEKKDIPA